MLVQQETLSTQPSFSSFSKFFSLSFPYPIFGIFEAGKYGGPNIY